ncbi:MAG TPA: hypothetical protein VNB49_03315, partial [Candidatus Dormibacteraeota bacterium]|nr:hypothetical protein [Candidatus Dormibacteraeota bacterium]
MKQKNKELKIRRAKIADAPRLANLSGQLGYPTTEAQIRQRFERIRPAAQHALFVAETKDAGVIG